MCFCWNISVKQYLALTSDNIIRGLTKNPRVKTLHGIALAFNMTLAEFLDFSQRNAYEFDQEDKD